MAGCLEDHHVLDWKQTYLTCSPFFEFETWQCPRCVMTRAYSHSSCLRHSCSKAIACQTALRACSSKWTTAGSTTEQGQAVRCGGCQSRTLLRSQSCNINTIVDARIPGPSVGSSLITYVKETVLISQVSSQPEKMGQVLQTKQ